MSLLSALRYRNFILRHTRKQLRAGKLLTLWLHHPIRARISLREVGSDPSSYQEILVLEVYKLVSEHVRDCRTIVDLGANIGLASLYFGARYPRARIVAVEPFPDNYRMLERNVAPLVRSRRMTTVEAAIWHHDAVVEVEEQYPLQFDCVVSKLAGEHGGIHGIPVPGISMKSLIAQQGLKQIDLLKVDIEGAETELFRGDTDWLKQVGAVAIEFHGNSRRESGFDKLMDQYGFQIRASNDHTVLAVA